MYLINTDGCRDGCGVVIDYCGNIWFFGTIEECEHFIFDVQEVKL